MTDDQRKDLIEAAKACAAAKKKIEAVLKQAPSVIRDIEVNRRYRMSGGGIVKVVKVTNENGVQQCTTIVEKLGDPVLAKGNALNRRNLGEKVMWCIVDKEIRSWFSLIGYTNPE